MPKFSCARFKSHSTQPNDLAATVCCNVRQTARTHHVPLFFGLNGFATTR
jgi:hypothetical protein